jgi:6-phosphogluconolactonase
MTDGAPIRVTHEIFDDLTVLVAAAASQFASVCEEAVAVRGSFRVALSGGSTPIKLHQMLAAEPYRSRLPWKDVEFFWGDERAVPPDDPQSNFGMARETLLEPLGINEAQIHRMRGELPPQAAALLCEQEMRSLFGTAEGEFPTFDLILLGMGPDGHTASLFPGTSALRETQRLVVANDVPQLNTTRITMTAPLINAARAVYFLVAGADKADALAEVLEGMPSVETYPSQLIAPSHGELRWLVDRAAAAKLAEGQG